MYTILVNSDNSLYGSHKERIIKGSNLVDELVFIVEPTYNGIDMTSASVVLEYVLPISREYKTEYLALSDEKYNDCFLQYKLPFNTSLTKEAGSIEVQLTFAYADMDTSGNIAQRVRKTSSTTIDIVPIESWSDLIPDSALSALDQRILKQDAQIRALADLANVLDGNANIVDDLVYNEKDDTLQLSARGVGVGNKVSVKEMLEDGAPVVDLNSQSENNPDNDDNSEEDNVVEF